MAAALLLTSVAIPVERQMDVLQRQLRSIGAAALIAVPRMPPRPEQTRPGSIQVDGEAFAPRIKVNLPVRTPLGRYRPTSDLDAF